MLFAIDHSHVDCNTVILRLVIALKKIIQNIRGILFSCGFFTIINQGDSFN